MSFFRGTGSPASSLQDCRLMCTAKTPMENIKGLILHNSYVFLLFFKFNLIGSKTNKTLYANEDMKHIKRMHKHCNVIFTVLPKCKIKKA